MVLVRALSGVGCTLAKHTLHCQILEFIPSNRYYRVCSKCVVRLTYHLMCLVVGSPCYIHVCFSTQMLVVFHVLSFILPAGQESKLPNRKWETPKDFIVGGAQTVPCGLEYTGGLFIVLGN